MSLIRMYFKNLLISNYYFIDSTDIRRQHFYSNLFSTFQVDKGIPSFDSCSTSPEFLPDLQSHNNDYQNHLCVICNKQFSVKQSLIHHMKRHSNIRPHVCTVCHKGFKFKWNLRAHMITHTGEKPYVCPVCFKSFGLKWNLRTHMFIHKTEDD